MSRHLRRIFEERLNRPGYAGGGGLGWNTPSPQSDDYWNQLKAKLPRPSAAAVKEGIKGLFREPTRLTSKYGLAYAPLDVVRNLASILPEGKGLAYGIDEMVDAGVPIIKHEGDELRRAGYNPLQYGLNAVDRAGNAVVGAAEGVPDAVRQAWEYLRSAGEASHDVAGYEAGGPVGTDPPEYTFNTPPSTAGSMPPAKVYADGGKVGEALSAIRKKFGRLQFNRAAEAADTTNLERFSPKGIMDTFDPKKSGLYLSLPPSTFQNYSAYLPTEALTATPYPRWYNMPASVRKKYASRDDMNLDNYLNEMASHMTSHGADAAPSLWLYRHDPVQDDPIAAALSSRGKFSGVQPGGDPLPTGTGVEGHEGRHRLMTMARLGDKNSLVHLLPANSGELRFPTDERMTYMLDKYFPQGADTPIVPEYMGMPRQPQSFGTEPFAGGGEVRRKLTTLARDIIGKPSRVKIPGVGDIPASPIKELEDVASQFAKRQGNQYPIDRYPEFDEDRARRIADVYDAMKHNPSDPATARAYDALISETMDQYKALKNAGIDFSFMKPGEQYPYDKSPAQGYMDMLYGRLKVFPTEQGFGTLNDIRDNPLLKKVGPVGDLNDATANDAFRAVHDALGHFGPGNPFFRHKGEDRAFLAHSRAYSPDAIPAAASELRGQNSWLNFGPHGPTNRTASEADTIFADQKTGLLPPWAYDDVMPGHADGGEVKPPVLGAGIRWIKKLDELFGPASKKAAADVRNNAETNGREALSYGTKRTRLEDLPYVAGEQDYVPVDYDTRSRINMLPWTDKFFTVHSHPFVSREILGAPQVGARMSQQGIPSTPHPSIGDLNFLSGMNPDRHTMMIEAAGQPNLRVALEKGVDPYSIAKGIDYLGRRNPSFMMGSGADPSTELAAKIRWANNKFGLHPADSSPLSAIFNTGLAKRGMNVMMDDAATTSGGLSLKDLLPEYTKFLGSDLPESWKADGGPVGLAGGGDTTSRLTKLAQSAMDRLKALRAEHGFDPKNPEYLPPDPKPQRGIVNSPVRMAYPGIYKSPKDIAQEAADLAERTSPDLGKEGSLYKVFGVTRNDLYDIMRDSDKRLPTDIPPRPVPTGGRGNAIAPQVLTDKNMQHQLDVLHETMGHSHLFVPSASWYTMDPVWDRMEQRGLPISDQIRTNNVTAMHSPSSSPYDEFARGLAALNFAKRGRLDDYIKYGSGSKPIRALPDYPSDMLDVPGHVAHDAHKGMVQKFLSNEYAPWADLTDAVKVPHYAAASDPRGAFLDNFVGDSHIARGLGFPDARTASTHGVIASNLSGPEYWSTLPWYQKLAQKAGMKPTPFQATQWTAFGPQTGVETVGKPKAEILADLISNRANKAGISIEQATDEILSNDRYKRGGSIDYDLYHVNNFKSGGSIDYDLFHATHWD